MIPTDWKIKSLGDICSGQLQTGPFGSQLHSHEYVNTGVAVLMPKDLNGCRADIKSAAKITEEKAESLSKHKLKSGDLLFSRRGDVARFALIDEKTEGALCGTGCLKATPNEEHSSEFLAYFLQKDAVRKWLEQNAVGQTMPNMNTSILSELPLASASSKDEETKIAKILSTWDKAITTTEQLLSNSQQQKKALMQKLLTGKERLPGFDEEWVKISISELVKIAYGKSPKNILAINGTYSVIGTGGVTGKTNEYLHKGPAVTIGRKGTIDKPLYISTPFWAIDTTFYCTPYDNCDIKWFFYLISSKNLKKYNEASGVPSLSRETVSAIKVSLPPLKEQQKIAEVLSTADNEISALQQKLHCLKQEKKALMQQLLTGKLRVKVDTEAA